MKKALPVLLLIFVFIFPKMCRTQVTRPEFKNQVEIPFDQEKKETQIKKSEPFSLENMGLLEPTLQALETAIDPEKYLVGPGDLFYINVWGEADFEAPVMVTPEGKIIIKTIGILDVAGKTLNDVKQLIYEQGKKKYKLTDITATLVQMRSIRVHVLGEVEAPGTYLAQPVDRVSVMVERAEGLSDWANDRAIEIHRKDGTQEIVDLVQFTQNGNLESNPFVRGGDVIYVPPINLSKRTVTLEGVLAKSGVYQILDGETVRDFLTRVRALTRKVDVSEMYLIRSAEGDDTKEVIKLDLYTESLDNGTLNDIELEDGDIIYAPTKRDYVYVAGAVQMAGSYPYYPGFTAIDYAGMAGGTSELGKIKGIKVLHIRDNTTEKGPGSRVERGDTVVVPRALRRKVGEYLSLATGIATLIFAFMAAQN